jgi:hypothetical protein
VLGCFKIFIQPFIFYIQGEDDGIVTVIRERGTERLHPLLQQLKNLKQVRQKISNCVIMAYECI